MESIKLKILRTDQQARSFIVEYNGAQWPVKQVPEQYGENPPVTIDCIVKTTSLGTYIEQNYSALISQHYKVGQEQIFDIVRANRDNYELLDAWGYTAYAERVFTIDTVITPKVRCRVKSISGKHPTVEILEALPLDTDGLTLHKESIRKVMNLPDDAYDGVIDLMLQDVSSELYDLKCMDWAEKRQAQVAERPEILSLITDFCKSLLEDTNYMQSLPKSERYILTSRVVMIIENVEYYSQALNMIKSGEAEGFIQQILQKLQTSGCLYHPHKRFHLMMYIFLLKPELMEQFAKPIFDTIRSKDLDFWKEEKLSGEWIALLEYYCQHLNVASKGVSRDVLKSNIIQALSLQQGLTDETSMSMYDDRLNRAMLYRYASEMEVQKPKTMLDIAYKNLVGITDTTMTNEMSSMDDPKRLANILYNQYTSTMDSALTPLQYRGEKALINITPDGICIAPADIDIANTENALSSTMNLWNNLQVRVPNRIKEKVTDSISRTVAIWNEIDQQLFSRDVHAIHNVDDTIYYANGDRVNFVVRKQINATTFLCDILDHHGVTAQGTISVDHIVKYHVPGITVNNFRTINGSYFILTGEVMRQDPQGRYQLTMINQVISEISHRHQDDWEQDSNYPVQCRVHHYNEMVHRYVGVDEYGFSVSVVVPGETEPWSTFEKGNIIEANNPDKNLINGFIQCEFVCVSDYRVASTQECFSNLMALCCDEKYYTSEDEQEVKHLEVSDFRNISSDHVGELISIIEQEASFENDYLKAYNYYGICRTLARIIGSVSRVDYFDNRLKLIQLLYHFNDTGSVDATELTRIENENTAVFSRHSQLQHTLVQLKMVSCLNRPELFPYITQLRNSTTDDQLIRLAKLVMAHNLLKEEGIEKEAESIYSQILEMLSLHRKVSNKKYYGEESQNIEFKPSIVFPPDEGMQANLRKQTDEILMQICAFLNSGGGTLYIGVLDSGYECGLKLDLKTEFDNSRDKLMVYINNKIHDTLGAAARRFLEVLWDDDAEEDVVIVNIKDCNQLISLYGEYYERRGSSVRKVEDIENFKHFRQQQINTRTERNEQTYKQAYQSPEVKTSTTSAPEPAVRESAPLIETIQTSQIRNNTLHEYEENYINDIAGYLEFLPDGKFEFNTDDHYDDQDKSLVLAIHENEVKGYIVCCYEDGTVCKVPISEILDKTQGQKYIRHTDKRLMFACPAQKTDSLMSILTSAKGDKYIRFDEVPTLCDGKMTDCGELIVETSFQEAIQFEIVETAKLSHLKVTYNKRCLGAFTKTGDGQKAKEAMESLGVFILS